MSFKDNLKALMDSQGLSQYRLEKLSGVPQPTILRALNGSNPRSDTIKKLATALGVTSSELIGDNISENPAQYLSNQHDQSGTTLASSETDAEKHQLSEKRLRRVPVLKKEEITSGKISKERDDQQSCWAMDVSEAAFALLVNDIPNPNDRYGIEQNAYIIVDPDQPPINGMPVLVKDTNQQLIIRRYEIVGQKRYLAPYNDKYDPIELDQNFTVIGRVISSTTVF